MKKIMKKMVGLFCAMALTGFSVAQAAEYPSHAIKWIVPYLAGTGPHMVARLVAAEMAKILKEPIVIENRGGVGGNIGAQQAAKATADGYTWVYSGSPMATNMRMYRKPGFDVVEDFAHVAGMTQSDSTIVVNANSGISSIEDLYARLRAKPGQLTYASGGIGTPAHMGAELALKDIETKPLHIPYKGASESLNAVMGNQVDFAVILVSVAQAQVKSGKINALAVLSSERNPVLPAVPTLQEKGFPDALMVSSGGISVPKGTPTEIVQTIQQTLFTVLQDPPIKTQLEQLGLTVVPRKSAAFTKLLESEIGKTEHLMKMMGLTPL